MAVTIVDGRELDVFDLKAGDKADYLVNWEPWLNGDAIATSAFTVPSGLTKVSESSGADSATVWLKGRTKGKEYVVSNSIVTSAGREKTHQFVIRVF